MHRESQPGESRSSGPPPRFESEPSGSMLYFKLSLAIFTMLLGVVLALCINVFDDRSYVIEKFKTAPSTKTTSVTKSSYKPTTTASTIKTTSKTTGISTTTGKSTTTGMTTSTGMSTTTTTTTTTSKPTTTFFPISPVYIFQLNDTPDEKNCCLEHKYGEKGNKEKALTKDLYISECTHLHKQQLFHYGEVNELRVEIKETKGRCVKVQRRTGLVALLDCKNKNLGLFPNEDSLKNLHEVNSDLCIKGKVTGEVKAVLCDDTEYTSFTAIRM